MAMRFWEENALHSHVKCESNSNDNIPPRTRESFYCEAANLNFATAEEECVDYAYRNHKSQVRVSRQDPMSHRIIEKRRRDRMNNCLADLSRLIPSEYLKKGRGRVEKTEIIEMAIKHMKHLQCLNHYRLGYQECVSEVMRFMVEVEGRYPHEPMCVKLLGHLQKHCEHICRATTDGLQQSDGLSDTKEQFSESALPEQSGTKFVANGHANDHGIDVDVEPIDVDHYVDKLECHEEVGGTPQDNLTNGYKYKNDIKLRFSQDNAKKPKLIPTIRRSSTPNSVDNQTCSSIDSPNPPQNSDAVVNAQGMRNIQDLDSSSTKSPWPYGDSCPTHQTSLSNLQRLFKNPFKHQHPNYAQPPSFIQNHDNKVNFHVPAFVLHAKGSFYIPITLDYQTVLPHLGRHDILHSLPQDVVLHPIAINVSFHHAQYNQPLNLQASDLNTNEVSKSNI